MTGRMHCKERFFGAEDDKETIPHKKIKKKKLNVVEKKGMAMTIVLLSNEVLNI